MFRRVTMPAGVKRRPDDPFILKYVVYHHFRSLGWIVRSGVKFAVDYLLYNRGPVFSHAEFAIVILPSYGNSYYTETPEGRKMKIENENRSWWWLHCINRVQSQVRKSLILAYVEIPPPHNASSDLDANVTDVLKKYKIREVSMKRWIPNRSRD
jgi:tRNA-splicing endonuclease subunit Sen2